MIHALEGKLAKKMEHAAVVDVGGVGFLVATNERTLKALPRVGTEVKLFTHLHVREDALDLYGFMSEEELFFFNLLNSVGGVGPKSALSILDVAALKEIEAAIIEERPDLLTRASGIGRKTAERIILELKTKVKARGSGATVRQMDTNADLEETLISLGYRREEAREAIEKTKTSSEDLSIRLKEALKVLSGKG
ncbi:MAG: Holliday junction branch migration protein RuvA [Candidatus Liptonbacteria bacterium]|nr:Holliday junction branch migration protein RuvA [Candidatus Liptonbacteria bacterium]